MCCVEGVQTPREISLIQYGKQCSLCAGDFSIFLVGLRFHSVENVGFGLGCDTK